MALLRNPPLSLAVDFLDLKHLDPDFAPYVNQFGSVDYQDPDACIQLAKSTLSAYFALKLEVPRDRLCPPIPNRYEYISFIRQLLDTTARDLSKNPDPDRAVSGFDVGTGASCIYPLLGTAVGRNWTFNCTETDEASYQSALANVQRNDLEHRIRVFKPDNPYPLFCLDSLSIQHADFTMCNPPFFSSVREMEENQELKMNQPSAVCTGSEVEMVSTGGEIIFVQNMINESLQLKTRVQWFTTMLGKINSVLPVVDHLKDIGVSNWAVTTLRPGARTRRWVVAWSFQDFRPPARLSHDGPLTATPPPSEKVVDHIPASPTQIAERVDATLGGLDLEWTWDAAAATGRATASGNVWSRWYRRAKARGENPLAGAAGAGAPPVQLVVDVSIVGPSGVLLRWVYGGDYDMWQSFDGMMRRTLIKEPF